MMVESSATGKYHINDLDLTIKYRKTDTTITTKLIDNYIYELKKLIKFFKKSPNAINVNFVYSKVEMDKVCRGPTPEWLCGTVIKDINIYLYSPSVVEKYSTHNRDSILDTLVHESVHIFLTKVNKNMLYWVEEGICQYFELRDAYRIEFKRWKTFKDNNLLTNSNYSRNDFAEYGGYEISHNMMKYIGEKFGVKKVKKLMKINRIDTKKKIESKLEYVLGINYNDLLNNFEDKVVKNNYV